MNSMVKTVVGMLALSLMTAGVSHANEANTHRINCAEGKKLQQALSKNYRPLIVEFTGTCTGDVVIPGDDITLRGGDDTATVVGTVSVIGRSRVTLQDFTIRDVPPGSPVTRIGDGIVVVSSQDVALLGMNVINAGNIGIDVESGYVRMVDCTVSRSRRHGISAVFGSVVEVRGFLDVNQSGLNGIVLTDHGEMQMATDSQVSSTDNTGTGLVVQLQSHTTLHGGTDLIVSRNGAGISVVDDGSLIFGPVTITVTNNRGNGVLVGQMSDWTVFGGPVPTLTITDNAGAGFLVIRNSFARLRENATIANNGGPGLSVDESHVAVRGTTIQNNTAGNVTLGFGSRATFDGGNTVPTPIACDGTVLVRGQFACPAPLATATATDRAFPIPDLTPVTVRERE